MDLFKLVGKIAIENDAANKAIDDTTDKASNSSESMTGSFKKIGGAIATFFAVDKIIDFGKEIVNVAAEVSAETSAFEQIMGDYSDEASAKVEKIAEATGMVDSRLTPYMTSMTAKFKGLGYDVSDATDYASRGLNLAADASAFWDKSLDESMSHLNSFINGSYEGGEAIGLFANDTQMAAYAVETGLVKETKAWSALDEATKQATRLEYAENMMKKSGATGQAAKEAGQYANVQANLTEKWRQFKAQIGEPLLQNIVIPAMDKLSGIVDKLSPAFENLCKWCSENKKTLENIAIVVGVVTGAFIAFKIAMGISTLINTVKAALDGMTISQWLLNAAMNANPIGIVVMAIAALVAGILLLWNNCDGFREAVIGMWEKIKAVWNQVEPYFKLIWDSIKQIFGVVVDFFVARFKAAWEGIKLVFSVAVDYFKMVWENIKLVFSVVATYFIGMFKTAWEGIKFVWNTVTGYFKQVWETIKGIFSVVGKVLKGDWQGAWDGIKKIVSGWGNYFSGVWNGIKKVFSSVKSWFSSTFSAAWNAIKGIFSNIGSFFSGCVTKVKNAFSKVKEIMSKPFDSAKNAISKVIDNIKSMFGNLKLDFPSLKLPHFSIKPKGWKIGDLLDGKIPKLGIDWYAKAMNNPLLLDKPTLFGYDAASGNLLGAGEKGAEVVAGANTLMGMIGGAVESKMAAHTQATITILTAILEAIINGNSEMLKALLDGQKIVIGEREFARLVKKYA